MTSSDKKNISTNTITNLPIQTETRQTPVNIEAERSLLGAIVMNNKAFESVENI